MEIEHKAESVIVDYVCDACKQGIMERDGFIILSSIPEQYPHKCSKCGHKANLFDAYPKIIHRRVK